MKRSMNRLLSILLALLMILQIMPISAMAEAETESITDEIVEILEEALEEQAVPDDTADSEESENNSPENDTESIQADPDAASSEDEATLPDDQNDEADESDEQQEQQSFEKQPSIEDEPEDKPTGIPYEEYVDGTSNYPDGTVVILEDPELFEPWPADAPLDLTVEVMYGGSWIRYAIYNFHHTYVLTKGITKVYDDTALGEDHLIYTISDESTALLVTEHYQRWNTIGVTVWFVTSDGNVMFGYVEESDLVNAYYTDEEAESWAKDGSDSCWLDFGEEMLMAFVADGWYPSPAQEPVDEQTIIEQPFEESLPEQQDIVHEQPTDTADPDDEQETILPSDSEIREPEEQPENNTEQEETESSFAGQDDLDTVAELSEASVDDPNEEEPTDMTDPFIQEAEIIPEQEELPLPDKDTVSIGDHVLVTTNTRVFLTADDTVADDYEGDTFQGYFVCDAVVEVEDILLDRIDREWYRVCYLYGDTLADGSLKWTETGSIYVLSSEAIKTDEDELTVTDYALRSLPRRRSLLKAASTTAMNGFTLKSINVQLPTLYAGQTGVYGSSGRDSEYKQIASVSGHGTVYATPHYLDGWTVYCLEHTLDGPGEGSGSNQTPKGPYAIVDIDTYMNTPGTSKVIYSTSTMHAIAWVLRHTYPFMVLDRSDSDNETWSRVAGQFAIRQVIREMEGAQYVRDYWDMDNFYVASGQAPAVYLEYARWLATNGIARGQITGKITVSNKSVAMVGGNYVGTVTLSTDADLIRIPRSAGTITGNTAGKDSSYYYLNSGDTIQITSNTNGFSVTAESVNSDAEEASFLVGVPDAKIQKVLIPMQGYPYKMQSKSLSFEVVIQYGDLTVTKRRDRGDERVLSGAEFQLYDSANKAVGNPITTDANGTAKWTHLEYGTYYLVETAAPTGYVLNSNKVTISINTASITYTAKNSPIVGSVSFVKRQKDKEIPLIGAQYELVTKSGNTYKRAVSAVDGSELPVLTTDANGKATWSNVVEYGTYYVHEVKAPEGFLLDNTYHAVSVTQHNKIVSADVDDPIITAKIKIAKTDGLTKEPLAGVEFTITRLSGPVALNGAGVGEVAAVITTDTNGYAETDWLDWGRFKVEETKVPAGYTDSHYSTEIEAYEDGKTYTISVENVPAAGYIRLTKTDANSHKPLKGVQFDIYQGETLITTMTTDANGVALSGALVKGTYTVKEHGNPEGYTGELTTLPVTVLSEQTTELSAENTPIQGKIRITKKDALTKEALAGVVFTVTCLSVSSATDGADVGKTFMLTTDQNGEAESGSLNYGKYRIEETSVPEHYVDADFSAEVEIAEHQKTYTVDVENEPTQGKIQITKTDKLDGQPIAGVVFDISPRGNIRSRSMGILKDMSLIWYRWIV